jgi:6-pyruvoyltetrahydropterin/6-carboxytetrahydropterin synthase
VTWRLSISGGFAAAHRIVGSGGKCESMHGHNFRVVLDVEGSRLDGSGMLVDFGHLKSVLASVLEGLDHSDLNENPAFSGESPSSENIARYIWREAVNKLSEPGITVRSVTVSESDTAAATYFPEGGME